MTDKKYSIEPSTINFTEVQQFGVFESYFTVNNLSEKQEANCSFKLYNINRYELIPSIFCIKPQENQRVLIKLKTIQRIKPTELKDTITLQFNDQQESIKIDIKLKKTVKIQDSNNSSKDQIQNNQQQSINQQLEQMQLNQQLGSDENRHLVSDINIHDQENNQQFYDTDKQIENLQSFVNQEPDVQFQLVQKSEIIPTTTRFKEMQNTLQDQKKMIATLQEQIAEGGTIASDREEFMKSLNALVSNNEVEKVITKVLQQESIEGEKKSRRVLSIFKEKDVQLDQKDQIIFEKDQIIYNLEKQLKNLSEQQQNLSKQQQNFNNNDKIQEIQNNLNIKNQENQQLRENIRKLETKNINLQELSSRCESMALQIEVLEKEKENNFRQDQLKDINNNQQKEIDYLRQKIKNLENENLELQNSASKIQSEFNLYRISQAKDKQKQEEEDRIQPRKDLSPSQKFESQRIQEILENKYDMENEIIQLKSQVQSQNKIIQLNEQQIKNLKNQQQQNQQDSNNLQNYSSLNPNNNRNNRAQSPIKDTKVLQVIQEFESKNQLLEEKIKKLENANNEMVLQKQQSSPTFRNSNINNVNQISEKDLEEIGTQIKQELDKEVEKIRQQCTQKVNYLQEKLEEKQIEIDFLKDSENKQQKQQYIIQQGSTEQQQTITDLQNYQKTLEKINIKLKAEIKKQNETIKEQNIKFDDFQDKIFALTAKNDTDSRKLSRLNKQSKERIEILQAELNRNIENKAEIKKTLNQELEKTINRYEQNMKILKDENKSLEKKYLEELDDKTLMQNQFLVELGKKEKKINKYKRKLEKFKQKFDIHGDLEDVVKEKQPGQVQNIETVRILEMEVETKKTELKHLRQKVDLLTSKQQKFEDLENKYKEEIKDLKSEIQNQQQIIQNYNNEVQILQAQKGQLENADEKIEDELGVLRNCMIQLEVEKNKILEQVRVKSLECEKSEKYATDLLEFLENMEKKYKSLETESQKELKSRSQKIQQLEESLEEITEERNIQKELIIQQDQNNKKIEKQNSQLQNENTKNREDVQYLEYEIEKLKDLLQKQKRESQFQQSQQIKSKNNSQMSLQQKYKQQNSQQNFNQNQENQNNQIQEQQQDNEEEIQYQISSQEEEEMQNQLHSNQQNIDNNYINQNDQENQFYNSQSQLSYNPNLNNNLHINLLNSGEQSLNYQNMLNQSQDIEINMRQRKIFSFEEIETQQEFYKNSIRIQENLIQLLQDRFQSDLHNLLQKIDRYFVSQKKPLNKNEKEVFQKIFESISNSTKNYCHKEALLKQKDHQIQNLVKENDKNKNQIRKLNQNIENLNANNQIYEKKFYKTKKDIEEGKYNQEIQNIKQNSKQKIIIQQEQQILELKQQIMTNVSEAEFLHIENQNLKEINKQLDDQMGEIIKDEEERKHLKFINKELEKRIADIESDLNEKLKLQTQIQNQNQTNGSFTNDNSSINHNKSELIIQQNEYIKQIQFEKLEEQQQITLEFQKNLAKKQKQLQNLQQDNDKQNEIIQIQKEKLVQKEQYINKLEDQLEIIDSKDNQLKKLGKDKSRMEEGLSLYKVKYHEIKDKIPQLEENIENQNQKIKSLKNDLNRKDILLQQYKQKNESLQAETEHLENFKEELNYLRQQLKRNQQENNSKIDSIKQLRQKLEELEIENQEIKNINEQFQENNLQQSTAALEFKQNNIKKTKNLQKQVKILLILLKRLFKENALKVEVLKGNLTDKELSKPQERYIDSLQILNIKGEEIEQFITPQNNNNKQNTKKDDLNSNLVLDISERNDRLFEELETNADFADTDSIYNVIQNVIHERIDLEKQQVKKNKKSKRKQLE